MACNWPTQGLPGPRTPEESKRVRKEYPGAGPQKSRKSAPRSLKRVRKSGFRLFSDSFETPGRILSDFWGPAPGYSFRTLFGLFRGSRARETLCGAGPIARHGVLSTFWNPPSENPSENPFAFKTHKMKNPSENLLQSTFQNLRDPFSEPACVARPLRHVSN